MVQMLQQQQNQGHLLQIKRTKEVGEDLAWVQEYRGVVFGLNIAMRRREECSGKLKALGDCEDAIKIVRFIEGLQQDDMEKRDHSLLLMREIEMMAADEDKNIAIKLNMLREEMLIICEKRMNLTDEPRTIRVIVVIQKSAEFVADTVRKDNV
nr:hypothetical protein [Tanacetum cinerariifolium]